MSSLLLAPRQPSPACADVASCRAAALEAAERSDFEAFHDLAWRAVQKGRPNDPELMSLLARAQSLSGRPGDALVMLRRLAELGAGAEARDSDDFRRVRALSGWAAVEERLTAATASRPEEPAPPEPTRTPEPRSSPPPAKAPATKARAAEIPTLPGPGAVAAGEDSLLLSDLPLDPVGLAYDSASRRFVVGDRRANKLIVADDVFKRVSDLIGAASAGFGTLTAVEIDRRRGDLWVSSTADDGAPSLHKLQLVSGRVLTTIAVPEEIGPATFSDIIITDSGTLLLLDSTGSRLLTVKTGAGVFERPLPLAVDAPESIASGGDVAYIAHAGGLSVVDLRTGRLTDVRASDGIALTGLRRIRSGQGVLIAIQTDAPGGSDRLVRIRLSRDKARVTAVETLDDQMISAGSALTISRDAAYYVARTDGGPVIRRVPLK